MTVLCAPNDMWFSDAAFIEMQREVPGVQVHISLSIQAAGTSMHQILAYDTSIMLVACHSLGSLQSKSLR